MRKNHIRQLADGSSILLPATLKSHPLIRVAFLILQYMFTVYVLYSPTYNKIYIGYTSNLENRLRSHNILATKGYTVKFRPWVIAHTEIFVSKPEAIKRETSLKTAQGRNFVWEIIHQKFDVSDG